MFHIYRHADPGVFAPFVDRDGGRGKVGLRKGSHSHSNPVVLAFDLPMNSGPASRAEMKDDLVAFVANADILLRLSADFDRAVSKACLGAKHATRATLAIKAMTDRNSDGVFGYGQR